MELSDGFKCCCKEVSKFEKMKFWLLELASTTNIIQSGYIPYKYYNEFIKTALKYIPKDFQCNWTDTLMFSNMIRDWFELTGIGSDHVYLDIWELS